MLPATQPDIIFKQKSEEYREKTLTMLYDLQLQIALLNTSYGKIKRDMDKKYIDSIEDCYLFRKAPPGWNITLNKDGTIMEYWRRSPYRRQKGYPDVDEDTPSETTQSVFSHKCPSEDCKGYVSNKWKCGVCSKHFCKDCHIIKENGHVCEEGLKATIKLIKSNTQKCPNCDMNINKIEGCNQMFCTLCHTPFDYVTGNIVKGVIHNPHYFEIQRLTNGRVRRQLGDIPCGGVPTPNELDITGYRLKLNNDTKDMVLNAGRLVIHISEITIPHIQSKQRNINMINLNNRIDFSLGKLDEKLWRTRIKRKLKSSKKDTDSVEICNMIVQSVSDILQRFVSEVNKECLVELDTILDYSNSQFSKIGEKHYYIDRDWSHIWL
jgi:hypothetical protein